ncbi:MAG: hypothetical protein GEU76_08375 [Alphaproteobacteria bacterium]|nr:hypothetical protein [Alphaproteobacteria bacterium]
MIPWLVAAISLGFATAFIARTKGRPFLPWLAYGTLLGVVAIPHALFLRKEADSDDDHPETRTMRNDSPLFTGSWAENWMQGDPAVAPRRRAAMAAGGPRRPDDVPATWSDDAFARIVGDEPPLAEFSATGLRGSPRERVTRDEPPLAEFGTTGGSSREHVTPDAPPARRPSPEGAETPGVAHPARRGASAGEQPFRREEARDTLRHPSAGRVNGNGMGRRDFLNLARNGDEDGQSAEDHRIREEREEEDSIAFARDRYDAGREEPRFEPRRQVDGNAWRTGDRYEDDRDEDAWIARRFAPDPTGSDGAYQRADRRESRRGNTLSYAVAALCMVLAAALVWPRPYDAPPPDRIASAPTAPALKEPGSGATGEPGTVTAGPTPFVPPSPRADDTFMRSDNTVTRSFVPPPLPPDAGTARAGGGTGDEGRTPPAETGQGTGTSAAIGVPPRPPEGRASAEPEIKPAPSPDVARVDPAAPDNARPTPGPATRSARVAPEKAAPGKAAPGKSARKKKSTGANRALSAPKDEGETITAVGQMVLLVQAELKKRGYEPGEVNGRAGEQTRQAIRQFKRKQGIGSNSTIDDELFERLGIVGRRLHPFASSSR